MRELTLDERTAMSRAYASGNYDSACESGWLDDEKLDGMTEHERAAYVLGFFGSFALDSIMSHRELFDECYWSDAGQYVVKVARYCDDRSDEYAADSEGC